MSEEVNIRAKRPGPNLKISIVALGLLCYFFFGCGGNGSSGPSDDSSTDVERISSESSESSRTTENPPAINIRINQVDTTYCPIVKSYVSVTDQDGNPVMGLTAADFFLEENTTLLSSVQVDWAASVYSPISVSMALDYSGSMSDAATAEMETAAVEFVSEMSSDDWGEIIKFSQLEELIQPFTPNKDALKTAITNQWPHSGQLTALYDAVYLAISDTASSNGRRAVIAMTDGADNVSSHTSKEVTDHAVSNGVPVFTVGLGKTDSTILEQIAEETGGQYFYAPNSNDLRAIYLKISEILRNQYVISYDSTLVGGGSSGLEVTAEDQGLSDNDFKQFSTCPDPPELALLNSIDTPGTANSLDVYGNYAYIADGPAGLQVVDISDVQNLNVVGSIDTSGSYPKGEAVDVHVSYPYAYVAANENGLVIVDVSDPGDPKIERSFPPNVIDNIDKVTSVYVSGYYCYLLDSDSGLAIIYIDDQREFHLAGTAPNLSGRDVAVFQRFVYVSNGDGLVIIDVSTPANPQIKGLVATPGEAKKICLSYPYLYIADGNTGGLSVVDVSLSENPLLMGELFLSGVSEAVDMKGSYAYVATNDMGVINIVDVSKPQSLEWVNSEATLYEAKDVKISGSNIYVADSGAGFVVLSISN